MKIDKMSFKKRINHRITKKSTTEVEGTSTVIKHGRSFDSTVYKKSTKLI